MPRWAKEHGINEARFQTLSSYSLTLMVLHYLQSGVFPPVLPSLQPEAPGLTGALPGQAHVDEALRALSEQLRARVDDVVDWDLHDLSQAD